MAGESTSSSETRRGHISGNTFALKEIEYAIVDGLALFEGDIVIGTEEEVSAAVTEGTRRLEADEVLEAVPPNPERGMVVDGCIIVGAQYRWPDGVIPYTIDPSLPNQSRVTGAIEHWQRNTSIRFVLRGTEDDFVTFRPDPGGCRSYVGRQGGEQHIWLAPGCDDGNAIHEIGHTIGLWHEQSREDRGDHVTVHLENVLDGYEHNFNQHIVDGDDVGPYDFLSCMHYPRDAFSKTGADTITPPAGVTIGQREGLSNGDVGAVDFMYESNPGNVHINLINADGTMGPRVERHSWSKGWTQAVPYIVGGNLFLFWLKERGFGADGNNVHLHRVNSDGTVGTRVTNYAWTQGWSTVSFYSVEGQVYLLLLKRVGYGADGNNVHIHRMNADGSVGPKIASYRWTGGWTHAAPYTVSGNQYLFLLKEFGFGADGNNVHLNRISADGTVGTRIHSQQIIQGVGAVSLYRAAGRTYSLLLRPLGE